MNAAFEELCLVNARRKALASSAEADAAAHELTLHQSAVRERLCACICLYVYVF
jgi:hypothetical protein